MKIEPLSSNAPTGYTISGPVIRWDQFNLFIEFEDYMQVEWQLEFKEVDNFKLFSSDDPYVSDITDDGIYEVLDSPLLASLIACGEIDEGEGYKHWLIGFNEIGSFIEVVFINYKERQP